MRRIRIISHSGLKLKSAFRNPQSAMALGAMLFALCASALAQQPTKIFRIGLLVGVSRSAFAARAEVFQQGLREFGYVEEKNIVIEPRYAEGRLDRLPALAAELVRLKADILVTAGGQATRAAKEASSTIPIAWPGGNITGLSTLAPELSGKRLELLKEIVPKLSRMAAVGTSTQPGHTQGIKELEVRTKAFSVQFQYLDVLYSKDIETAFRAAAKGRAEGILTLTSPILRSQRVQVAALTTKNRIPAIYNDIQFVEAGGLIFYGVSYTDLDRHAAAYVDKLLKGAKPAALPVEQPKKFEFVINLKAAKQIGLTIPPNVLARADRVIK